MARDRLIDGYRGVAVCGVILGHALVYRYHAPHLIARLAGPAAYMGVQLFFAISGFIITSLLLKEEARDGRVSIAAFYVRRCFRILPPLLVFYASLFALMALGVFTFDPVTVLASAAFTCNTGFTTCDWWVAHTWSLAVEEQYYLAWPLLFVMLPHTAVMPRRGVFLVVALVFMATCFLVLPLQPNSNWIAFSSIAAGALYATSQRVRATVERLSSYWLFIFAVVAFAAINLYELRVLAAVTPVLILIILFAPRKLPMVRTILESAPLNAIGLISYSLYLWQQIFLARPERYEIYLPLIALPLIASLSYFLVERPFSRIGHSLSLTIRNSTRPPAAAS